MIFLICLPVAIFLYGTVFHAAWTGRIRMRAPWYLDTYDCKTEPFMYWVGVGGNILLATAFLIFSLHDLFGDTTAR